MPFMIRRQIYNECHAMFVVAPRQEQVLGSQLPCGR